MIVQRLCKVLIVLCLGAALGSCGSIASFTSDYWPHWAGGEPAGIPPRKGTPGYDEYIAHQQANGAPTKPAAPEGQPVAQAAPAEPPAPTAPATYAPPDEADRAVTHGGLY